jgi:CspA family cold shock protein
MPSKAPQTAITTSSETTTYDNQDIFFQSLSFANGGQLLREGQTVTYDLRERSNGVLEAFNIRVEEEPIAH